jgi:hypothetical protein
MAAISRKDTHSDAKIKGPIRCHTCRILCRDAEHYLSHKCTKGLSLVGARRIATAK